MYWENKGRAILPSHEFEGFLAQFNTKTEKEMKEIVLNNADVVKDLLSETPVTKKKAIAKTEATRQKLQKNPIKITKKKFHLTVGTILGFILGIVLSAGIGYVIYSHIQKASNNDEKEMMMRRAYYITLECEQDYWSVKGEIIKDMEHFIYKNAPFTNLSAHVLLLECDKGNLDVRLPMAQGLIEGHYGTKGLSAQTNNLCNVGAYDGLAYEDISDKYKSIPHINESIEPYVELINRRYLSNGRGISDLLNEFVDIDGKRYASNPLYEQELKHTINQINTETRLDSLLQKYNYLRRELGK